VNLTWPAEYVPLALLEPRASHGYDLHRAIGCDPVLRSIWRLGRSELYFLLKKLENRDWILPQASEVVLGPRRTTYVITQTGREALHTWLATPVPNPRDLRAEFLAKVYLGRVTGAPETPELLRGQRQVLEERLARQKGAIHTTGFVRHVYSLRSLQTQAALEWLSGLEAQEATEQDPLAVNARSVVGDRRVQVRAGRVRVNGLASSRRR
jgi:DNA-binding PadR family transcriptional regulator